MANAANGGADDTLFNSSEVPMASQGQRPESSNSGAPVSTNIAPLSQTTSPTISKTQLIRKYSQMTWQAL